MKLKHYVLLLLLFASGVYAEEGKITHSAVIKGIEANPRVTFIVPWQRSRMKDFPQMPAHSALDEIYKPLSSRQLELDVELGSGNSLSQP